MTGFRDDFSSGTTLGTDLLTGALAAHQRDDTTAESPVKFRWPAQEEWFTRTTGELAVATSFDDGAAGLGTPEAGFGWAEAWAVGFWPGWDPAGDQMRLHVPADLADVKGTAVLGVFTLGGGDNNLGWPRLVIAREDGTQLARIGGQFMWTGLLRAGVTAGVVVGAEVRSWDDATLVRQGGVDLGSHEMPVYLRAEVDNTLDAGSVTLKVTADEAGETVYWEWSQPHGLPGDGAPVLPLVEFAMDMYGPKYRELYGTPVTPPTPLLSVFSWNYTAPLVTPVTTIRAGDGDAGALAR